MRQLGLPVATMRVSCGSGRCVTAVQLASLACARRANCQLVFEQIHGAALGAPYSYCSLLWVVGGY